MSFSETNQRVCATLLLAGVAVLFASCEAPPPENVVDPVQRGAYLVRIMGCGDCHTPGYFLGMPDETRALGGSDVGFFIPGLGYFYGANLTPDPETGLGNWSDADIVTAIRTGTRPDGRILAPSMPWAGYANLTDEDANAIAAYLRSLAPISNQAPPPTGADQLPPAPYMTVVFPDEPDTQAQP